MEEYEQRKSQGEDGWRTKKMNGAKCVKNSRSRHYYGKIDKSRKVRKKADRAAHHRRRNQVRNAQSIGLEGPEMLARPSSSKRTGNQYGHSWQISNLKM